MTFDDDIDIKDQLGEKTCLNIIENTPPVEVGSNLDNEQWKTLLSVIGGASVYRKPENTEIFANDNQKIRSRYPSILSYLNKIDKTFC